MPQFFADDVAGRKGARGGGALERSCALKRSAAARPNIQGSFCILWSMVLSSGRASSYALKRSTAAR